MKLFPVLAALLASSLISIQFAQAVGEPLTVTVQSQVVNTNTSGTIAVTVTNTTAASIGITGWTVRVSEGVAQPNVILGVPSLLLVPAPIQPNNFATPNGALINTASDVSAGTFGASDPILAASTRGMISIPYTIINGFTGAVQLVLNTNVNTGTSFTDPSFNFIAYAPVNGTLTVLPVPEPASLALLALGAPLLLRRRRVTA